MHGDAAGAFDADGADFAGTGSVAVEPDACGAGDAAAGDAVGGDGADDGFFEAIDVFTDAYAEGVEVENGVSHELSGSVEGDVAATVDFEEVDVFCGKLSLGEKHVGSMPAFAEGVDGIVLDEKEDALPFRFAGELGVDLPGEEALLKLPHFAIGTLPEVLELYHGERLFGLRGTDDMAFGMVTGTHKGTALDKGESFA